MEATLILEIFPVACSRTQTALYLITYHVKWPLNPDFAPTCMRWYCEQQNSNHSCTKGAKHLDNRQPAPRLLHVSVISCTRHFTLVTGCFMELEVIALPAFCADASDRGHAETVAAAAGLRHYVIEASLERLLRELPWVVRVLQTFDPMALRNSIAGAPHCVPYLSR